MSSIISSIFKGAASGLGFGLSFFFIAFLYAEYIVEEDDLSKKWSGLSSEEKKLIDVSQDSISVKNGRIIIRATAKNGTSKILSSFSISALVNEENIPIEKCSANSSETMLPGDSESLVILCTRDWENINQEKLSTELKVSHAMEDINA